MQATTISERRQLIAKKMFFARTSGRRTPQRPSVMDPRQQVDRLNKEIEAARRTFDHRVFLPQVILSNITARSIQLMRLALYENGLVTDKRDGPSANVAGAFIFGRYTAEETEEYDMTKGGMEKWWSFLQSRFDYIDYLVSDDRIDEAMPAISQVAIASCIVHDKFTDKDAVIKGHAYTVMETDKSKSLESVEQLLWDDVETARLERLCDEMVDEGILDRENEEYVVKKTDCYANDFV